GKDDIRRPEGKTRRVLIPDAVDDAGDQAVVGGNVGVDVDAERTTNAAREGRDFSTAQQDLSLDKQTCRGDDGEFVVRKVEEQIAGRNTLRLHQDRTYRRAAEVGAGDVAEG